jgi:hypothetical protein
LQSIEKTRIYSAGTLQKFIYNGGRYNGRLPKNLFLPADYIGAAIRFDPCNGRRAAGASCYLLGGK